MSNPLSPAQKHKVRRLLQCVQAIKSANTIARLDRLPQGFGTWTLSWEHRNCGRPNCTRCPHGPYLYARQHKRGKVTIRYLGT